jgi:hypothetical protein
MVTPGVVVSSVDEIDVALAQPLFFNTTFILTQSLLLMTPLLPLIGELTNSRFEVPTMVKFRVVVPPLVMVTVGLAGEADVQFRSASAAVAV